MSKWERMTRVDGEHTELIQQYTGTASDVVILVREACSRIVADDLRQVEITQEGKDYKITVRARK